MARALDLAPTGDTDDIPVAALVVHDGSVIAQAANGRSGGTDPTAHAEVVALRAAGAHLGTWRLDDCELIVTLEPCPMCAGAAVAARVGRIVFGAWNEQYGACGSLFDIPRDPRLHHRCEVVGGVLAHDAGDLVRTYLASRR